VRRGHHVARELCVVECSPSTRDEAARRLPHVGGSMRTRRSCVSASVSLCTYSCWTDRYPWTDREYDV
jgi:hypothetical protein